jgi:hypothetical protein
VAKLQEAENQIVVDYQVYDRRPSDSERAKHRFAWEAGGAVRWHLVTSDQGSVDPAHNHTGLWTARATEGPSRPQPLSLFQPSKLIYQPTSYRRPPGNILR